MQLSWVVMEKRTSLLTKMKRLWFKSTNESFSRSSSLEIGALVELDIGAISQNAVAQIRSIRHSMLYFENSMGTVKFGDTSHAGGDFVGVDMSGTSHLMTAGTLFDSVKFNDSSSIDGSQAAGVTVATTRNSDMSLGRQVVLDIYRQTSTALDLLYHMLLLVQEDIRSPTVVTSMGWRLRLDTLMPI